ncbi:MAG: ATP-binding protein [Candidatus Binatia bacterium]
MASSVPADNVADRMLASRRFMEGERKRVTVLFADIRGSTSFIEKLDPEEVRKHFDPVLRVMMAAVHRYDGTVNQVLGDGIMALFGAPLAHEDHALRACYAALAMQADLRRGSGTDGALPQSSRLQIGIGINSGEVVVRSLTNDLNIDYSALGQTTHLAARMESLAGPGSIAITADTLREVEGFVEVRPLGALQVKGFSTAIDAFELTGATAARNRLQAAEARGLSPFVGRRTEIAFARQMLAQTAAGHGRILAVVGEAGMGKSRLLRQFLDHHVSSEWRVVAAPSVSYGKATPYFPVIELLRGFFNLHESDDADAVRSRVAEEVLTLDPSLSDAVAPILALLEALPDGSTEPTHSLSRWLEAFPAVAVATANYRAMDLPGRRASTLAVLVRLLLRASSLKPLLLVFEDLHWIDSETQAFLDALVDSLPVGRICLLVNYRPGYSHAWANKEHYSRLRLNPLTAAGAEELLDALMGDHGDLATVKQLLISRADGNPFFVEESVRSLTASGVLLGSKGNYRPGVQVENIRIPNTVQTVLAERVDRLPALEKQLLQTASVIGMIVPERLLHGVTGLPEAELRGALSHLQTGEFLYESNLYPKLEYKFTHALINEVVYGALLHERKTALHAQTVAAIERLSGGNRLEEIEALADHAFRGELWEKAADYMSQAGGKAMSHSAFGEALDSYTRAFEALGHLPETAARLEQRIDLHLDCRNVLFLRGDLPRVGDHLAQAEALAERIGDSRRLARVLNFQNSYYGLVGDPERAIEAGQRALAMPATQQDTALRAVTSYYTGVAYNKIAQYERAATVLRSGMQSVEGALRHQRFGTTVILSVIFRSHLLQSLAMTGDFAEGLARGAEGVQIADEANHPVSQIHVNASLGFLYIFKGDYHEAIPVLERAMTLCEEKLIAIYVPLVAPRLGYAYVRAGRQAEGLRLLEQSIEDSAAVGRAGFLALNLAWLSDAYLSADRVDEAMVLADRACDLSRQHKEPGHGALALKLRGDIAMRLTLRQIEQAEGHYREALRLASDMAMRPLQAHCHAALAQVYGVAGNLEQARQESSAARELFAALAMNGFLTMVESDSTRFS